MSGLGQDKIEEIKGIIAKNLSESDFSRVVRDIINEYNQKHSHSGSISRARLIQELENRGFIDSAMSRLQIGRHQPPSPRQRQSLNLPTKPTVNSIDPDQLVSIPLEDVNFDANRRHLYIQFLDGKAFTGNLNMTFS